MKLTYQTTMKAQTYKAGHSKREVRSFEAPTLFPTGFGEPYISMKEMRSVRVNGKSFEAGPNHVL